MLSKSINFSAVALAAAVVFLSMPVKAHAQSCTTPYGGAVTCPPFYVVIDKQVWSGKESKWVENLGVESAFVPVDQAEKGSEGSIVKFRLRVTNTNPNRTYKAGELTIRDDFPYFLKMVSGRGTVSGDSVSFTNPEEIKPGETREYGFEFQVKPAAEIPGPATACANNIGVVSGADTRGDEDRARVCFGKMEVKKLPVAGFGEMALILPFIGAGAGGLMLLTKRQ